MDHVTKELGVSERRACRVLLVDTSTYHYKSRRCGQADLEKRIKEIAETIIRMTGSRSQLVYRPLPTDDPKQRRPDITLAQRRLTIPFIREVLRE